MEKTRNDRLAEYVRKKYPGIEDSFDYKFYKIACAIRNITQIAKKRNIGEISEMEPYEDPIEYYEGEWISVEERLPELNDDGASDKVLLCWSDGQIAIGTYAGDRTFIGQDWPEATDASVKVVAWMPIPEPYDDGSLKGEEDGMTDTVR